MNPIIFCHLRAFDHFFTSFCFFLASGVTMTVLCLGDNTVLFFFATFFILCTFVSDVFAGSLTVIRVFFFKHSTTSSSWLFAFREASASTSPTASTSATPSTVASATSTSWLLSRRATIYIRDLVSFWDATDLSFLVFCWRVAQAASVWRFLPPDFAILSQSALAFLLMGFFLEHLFVHAHFFHFAVFSHICLLTNLSWLHLLLTVKLREKLLVAFLNGFELSWLDLVALANSADRLFRIAFFTHFSYFRFIDTNIM